MPDIQPPAARPPAALLGPRGMLTDPADLAPHLSDWRMLYTGRTPCVLRPASTAELAELREALRRGRQPLVPQGGNTSMVGGGMPDESGRQMVVSLARLNRVRDIDPLDMTMTAEAGVIVKAAQDAAADAGCLFPLSFGGEGTATIGGVLSTNAGGNTTVRYGNARELMLGLEVVLPDGQIWNGLRRLRKDNTGYALRHLFVGAEGTLGFITAAVLRLFARPARDPRWRSAPCATRMPPWRCSAASATATRPPCAPSNTCPAPASASTPASSRAAASRSPARADHYVLVDLASSRPDAGLRALLEAVLEEALEAGEVLDAAIGESEAQRAAIWRIREEHPEAQKREGASVKNDVSVPVSRDAGADPPRLRGLPRSSSPASARCPSAIWATATST